MAALMYVRSVVRPDRNQTAREVYIEMAMDDAKEQETGKRLSWPTVRSREPHPLFVSRRIADGRGSETNLLPIAAKE